MSRATVTWSCPVCRAGVHRPAFRSPTAAGSGDELAADRFRPAASDFGATVAEVVRCEQCGHGSLSEAPAPEVLDSVYAHVEDVATVDEEAGQVATSRRDLERVAAVVGPERRRLLDVGCWTGSLLAAAEQLGWEAEGLEPSDWAVAEASARGRTARVGVLGPDDGLAHGSFQVVACCDVLEHLLDPGEAATHLGELLEPGGVLFATVPDAGSRLARVLGRRWWSVLPMHVQYFTRSSFERLLTGAGLEVLEVSTHPKLFSRRYYGDRFGEFVPVVGAPVARAIGRSRGADKLVGPDFRDRIAVLARRPERAAA